MSGEEYTTDSAIAVMAAEFRGFQTFYISRPSVDENTRSPSTTEISGRECMELAEKFGDAADLFESIRETSTEEISRLTARIAELEKALTEIRGGSFPGATEMALTGNWKGIVAKLQEIARTTLEASERGWIEEMRYPKDDRITVETWAFLDILASEIRRVSGDKDATFKLAERVCDIAFTLKAQASERGGGE